MPIVRMNPKRTQEIIRAVKESGGLISESLREARFSGLKKRHEDCEEIKAAAAKENEVSADVL
jgi:hypothetical protein